MTGGVRRQQAVRAPSIRGRRSVSGTSRSRSWSWKPPFARLERSEKGPLTAATGALPRGSDQRLLAPDTRGHNSPSALGTRHETRYAVSAR